MWSTSLLLISSTSRPKFNEHWPILRSIISLVAGWETQTRSAWQLYAVPRLVDLVFCSKFCRKYQYSTPVKACNTCRRKKAKCDGKRPICSQCHSFGFSCTFQDVRRQPSRTSRYVEFCRIWMRTLTWLLYSAYVEELEKRIQILESQLERQRTIRDSDQDSTRMDHPHESHASPPATPSTVDDPVMSQNEAEADQLSRSDQDSYVINSHDGKIRFFGKC